MMLRLCTIGRTRIHGFIGTEGKALRATRALLDALPPMTAAEKRAASSPLRVMRLLPATGLTERSMRSPNHSVSPAGIFSGAPFLGELALAHLGALVLLNAPFFYASILGTLPKVLLAGHIRGIPTSPVVLVLHVRAEPYEPFLY
jgi:predicted ATPase with chaperone activity